MIQIHQINLKKKKKKGKKKKWSEYQLRDELSLSFYELENIWMKNASNLSVINYRHYTKYISLGFVWFRWSNFLFGLFTRRFILLGSLSYFSEQKERLIVISIINNSIIIFKCRKGTQLISPNSSLAQTVQSLGIFLNCLLLSLILDIFQSVKSAIPMRLYREINTLYYALLI